MRSRPVILTSLALGALLLGCGEPETVEVTVTVPVAPTPADIEEYPPADESGAPEEEDVWAEHRGDIPWVIGSEAGLAQAEKEGKPILFFYTATW